MTMSQASSPSTSVGTTMAKGPLMASQGPAYQSHFANDSVLPICLNLYLTKPTFFVS